MLHMTPKKLIICSAWLLAELDLALMDYSGSNTSSTCLHGFVGHHNATLEPGYCDPNILNLRARGILEDLFPQNCTHQISQLLNRQSQHVYAGFDPTANSLHIGHLLVLMNLLHWQRAGHHVIILVGTATAQIGDPSGRLKDRDKLRVDDIHSQAQNLNANIRQILSNHEKYFWPDVAPPLPPVTYVNNEHWYKHVNVIDFLSNAGRHFRMGTMLLKESVAKRLHSEYGMCFTEFTYQIFQAYDWLHLFREYDCRFQIGGTDQMGNIASGHHLIGRSLNETVYGLTLPLMTTESGHKFGKSVANSIWLNGSFTSPFEFYQFLVRTEDNDVEKFLKVLTFVPLEEIERVMGVHRKRPELRTAQRRLADEVTLLVHGQDQLQKVKRTSGVLYCEDVQVLGQIPADELATIFQGAVLVEKSFRSNYTILQFARDIPCFPSNSEASRKIMAGAFYINLKKVANKNEILSRSLHILPNNMTVVRVGKKNYWIVKWLNYRELV